MLGRGVFNKREIWFNPISHKSNPLMDLEITAILRCQLGK